MLRFWTSETVQKYAHITIKNENLLRIRLQVEKGTEPV